MLRVQPVIDTPTQCGLPGTTCPTSFKLKLKNDTPIVWPGILSLLLFLITPIIALISMASFETKRWADSNVRNSG